MKKYPFYILFLLIITVISSCSSIEPLTVSKVKNVKLKNFSKNSVSLEVTFIVKNPNWQKFTITDNHFNVFLNSSELGTAKIKEKIIIPGKSENDYTFLIDTHFTTLALSSIPSLINIFKTKQVEFKLTGNVKVKTMGFGKRFPVEIIETVPFSKSSND